MHRQTKAIYETKRKQPTLPNGKEKKRLCASERKGKREGEKGMIDDTMLARTRTHRQPIEYRESYIINAEAIIK